MIVVEETFLSKYLLWEDDCTLQYIIMGTRARSSAPGATIGWGECFSAGEGAYGTYHSAGQTCLARIGQAHDYYCWTTRGLTLLHLHIGSLLAGTTTLLQVYIHMQLLKDTYMFCYNNAVMV